MLPRSLDASASQPLMAMALAELVATCFRLGWLYRISPIRLCSNYGLDDQQRLGGYLLAIGVGLLMWLGWKLLWGCFETPVPARRQEGRVHPEPVQTRHCRVPASVASIRSEPSRRRHRKESATMAQGIELIPTARGV